MNTKQRKALVRFVEEAKIQRVQGHNGDRFDEALVDLELVGLPTSHVQADGKSYLALRMKEHVLKLISIARDQGASTDKFDPYIVQYPSDGSAQSLTWLTDLALGEIVEMLRNADPRYQPALEYVLGVREALEG